MPKRRTSISLGGGLLLALTLALSGCDRGADQEAAHRTAPADSTQAAPAVAVADTGAACLGPAPQPFATLNPTGPEQPWSLVTTYLQQNPLAPDSMVGEVTLCKSCNQIQGRLRPLANTCAIRAKTGETWLMGRIATSTRLTGANIPMFGPGNDSSLVYLVTKGKATYVIYPMLEQGRWIIGYVRGINPNTPRWNFMTCPDTAHGKAAWGTYKAGSTPQCGQMRMTADSQAGKDSTELGGGDPGEELSYSWMACIGGCCRFYGPQPPFGGEEGGGGNPGGGNPGGGNPGGGNPGGGNPGGGQKGRP